MFLNFLFATFMFLMQIASWAFRAEILYNITKLHFCSLQHIRLVKNKLRQRHYPHFTLRTECTITTTNLNSVLKPSHVNREPHLTHLCKDSPKLLLTFSVHSAISVFQSMSKICRKPYYRYYLTSSWDGWSVNHKARPRALSGLSSTTMEEIVV